MEELQKLKYGEAIQDFAHSMLADRLYDMLAGPHHECSEYDQFSENSIGTILRLSRLF